MRMLTVHRLPSNTLHAVSGADHPETVRVISFRKPSDRLLTRATAIRHTMGVKSIVRYFVSKLDGAAASYFIVAYQE